MDIAIAATLVNRNRTHPWAIIVLICLAAVSIRLVNLNALSVWFDEGFSIHAAEQPLIGGVIQADPTDPPVYYLLLHTAIRLFGDSTFSLRWVSILLGILLIAVSFRLAYSLFGMRAAVYTTLLVALSPPLWWASREIRMYGFMAILLVLMAFAWWQLTHRMGIGSKRVKRRYWLLLWCAEGLLLYTHAVGPIAALWINVVTILVWFICRNIARPDWRIWLAGQSVLFVVWLPWLVGRFLLLHDANQGGAATPLIGLPLLSSIWQSLWAGSWNMVDHEPVLMLGSVLAIGITLVITPWRLSAARWHLLHVVLLVSGLVVGLIIVGIGLHGRYLIMAIPLMLIVIAGGLARIRQRGVMWAAIIAFPFVAVSGWSIAVAASNPSYQHDDAALMVQYYAANLTSQDTVLAWSYADRYELGYYWPRLGVSAQRVTLPEGADIDVVQPLLPTQGKVALNVWFTQRADQRRMMPCLLENGGTEPPVIYTVYGMSDELYAAPPTLLPTLHPASGEFNVARVTGTADLPSFTADQAMCLPIRITLKQRTPRDLKAVLVVKNSLGWEIARADAIFARADQKTSSQLATGDVLMAYPHLRLPYGAPPGSYTVILRLYDDDTLSGYDLLSDTGLPMGKDLFIGDLHVRPGATWQSVTPDNRLLPTYVPQQNGLVLIGQSMSTTDTIPINNGSVIHTSLLWQGDANLPLLKLQSQDGQWVVPISPTVASHDSVTLDMREARIPAQAQTGGVDLVLPSGIVLAHYGTTALPGLFEKPQVQISTTALWSDITKLTGFSMVSTTVKHTESFTISLVWQGVNVSPVVGYTVFAQLIDEQDKVIAQSDSIPARGARPTTGWRPNEYIVDEHLLTFKENVAPSRARLIVGLYDANTGVRAVLSDARNYAQLPVVMDVR